jgi:hypothetical protein
MDHEEWVKEKQTNWDLALGWLRGAYTSTVQYSTFLNPSIGLAAFRSFPWNRIDTAFSIPSFITSSIEFAFIVGAP